MRKIPFCAAATLLAVLSLFCGLGAQTRGATVAVSGTVRDGVGRAVAGASVRARDASGAPAAATATGADGGFRLELQPGEYTLTVEKATFSTASLPLRVAAGAPPPPPPAITLDLAPLQQQLVVTATGVATPQTQLGQTVATLDGGDIAARAALTLDESLRDFPGVQVVRSGAPGGLSSLSLRGADANFNQILLDGVPLQRFDAGAFDFSTLLPSGLATVTLVQGADSVVYGSNAAAGVVDLRSRSGAGLTAPEFTASSVAGSYGTNQDSAGVYGNWRPIDYGFTFGYLDAQNQVPHNQAWNQSWSGNVGIRLPDRMQMRLTSHRTSSRAGDPNAFDLYGVADDSWQREGETYSSLWLQQATTAHWTNQITLSQSKLNYAFATLTPTGTPFDPYGYGANYLGLPVTIRGANGYSVSGQAILDYAGVYPERSASDTVGRYLDAESDDALSPNWRVIGGYRADDQRGYSAPRMGWHSQGVFSEVSGGAWNRVFATAGVSEDVNSRFGDSFNPQASLAVLPRLRRGGWWNELRLRADAGTAQMNPTLLDSQYSLYQYLVGTPAAGVAAPLAPQRAHTFELGLDQYLAGDVARFSATWFDDRYDDLIQFVPTSAFPQLGVGAAATAAAQAEGGAYLNALDESSKGMELELEARATTGWHGRIAYTYLDPVVRRSFSSDALAPSTNPAFPTIPIGAYAPLVGARPFRVAPESGVIEGGYDTRRWTAEADASLLSRRDDSTFLSDGYFGTSLLLPNHDLAPAYAALNLSGTYQVTPRLALLGAIENLLNQNYQQVFGFPSLGRAARVGIRISLSRAR